MKHPVAEQWSAEVGAAVRLVFGDRCALARRYVEMLAGPGVVRGVIGPREADRLWERHLLNSAALSELLPDGARVLDVGSGAGLPGIPLAIARPDLRMALLEPMARRVAWLQDVVGELGLDVAVHRGRAEEPRVRDELGGHDAVTARAVAPLGRLVALALPLVAPGGRLLAVKGASAEEELARDGDAVRVAGGVDVKIVSCGATMARLPATTASGQPPAEPAISQPPAELVVGQALATVIVVSRLAQRGAIPSSSRPTRARQRKDR